MEIANILAELERNRGTFPQEAVEAAVAQRDEVTPHLLRILADTIERAAELAADDRDEPWMGHFHAFYLLAQFRDPRAYPLAIRFARLPSATLDALGGDLVTEGFPRILASVFDGDLDPIKALIEDAEVDEYARSSGLGAIAVLVSTGRLPREEAVAYLAHLFRGGLPRRAAMIWDCLASCAVDLHPGELLGDLRKAYDGKLCKPSWIPWQEIEDEAAKPITVTLAETLERDGGLIDDTVAELSWWDCFQSEAEAEAETEADESPADEWLDGDDVPGAAYAEAEDTPPVAPPYVRQEPKIGRNEPCPCGSGRKYKKCCGQ